MFREKGSFGGKILNLSDAESLHTTSELAAHPEIQVHIGTIYRWVGQGCPYQIYRKTYRFDLQDVLEWLENEYYED